jgi:HEAT repeat protein
MIEILNAIETKDWYSLQAATNKLADSPTISIDSLIEILKILPSIVIAFPDQFTVEHKGNQIIRHRYETLIWEIGEIFRQVLKKHKRLRQEPNLFSSLARVTLDTQFGKGRESFVMLLGQYGDQNMVGTLVQLLKDEEVQGHAVYALRLLGAPEVQDSVRPFLKSPKTWVRNEAKKYFQKFENQRSKI